MSTEAPQIVHESETQRQFVRLPMPAQAIVEGKKCEVRDLSAGGIAIRDVGRAFNRGDEIAVGLVLPFGGFSLDIALRAQVQ